MDFYEKPGCINGEKQKRILQAAGNKLNCIDILSHPWSREALLHFVAGRSPQEMMNETAPAIKRGDIRPADLSFDQAVTMMVEDPILIKRPLIAVDGMCIQGFTDERLKPYLGSWDGRENVITCPHLQTLSCDER
ncbi:MAG: ArsC/Spx/MgsR family protein [Desulfopila sp.]